MLEPLRTDNRLLWKPFSLGSSHGLCSPSLDWSRWHTWLEQLPDLLASPTASEIRYSSLLTTGRRTFQLCGADGLPVIVKCYPAVSGDVKPSLGGEQTWGQNWAAFCCHLELWQEQLPVPEPLVFVEYRQEASGVLCHAVTRLLEGCQPLTHFAFDNLCRRSVPPELLEKWVAAIVEAIVRLHRAGYSHGDLHHHNILVRASVPEGGLQVFFADFDACERHVGVLPHQAQLHDLASLAASLYQLVPNGLLAKARARYIQAFRLEAASRKQCLQELRLGYHAFLSHYQACFQRVEEFYFAQAERDLVMAKVSS